MVSKKQTNILNAIPPKLVESRDEAKIRLKNRIDKGKALRDQNFQTQQALNEAENSEKKWSEFNSELLTRLFDNTSIADEYKNVDSSFFFFGGDFNFHDEVKDFKERVGNKITKLESILDRLDIIPELNPLTKSSLELKKETDINTKDIFIVHGQEEGAKETVARFISKIDLNPIILHEQVNEGKTIIEKFESHASNVSFAVVLMTPDDVGYVKDKPENLLPRARQNVIFELGYFIGKLSRKNVCALYKEGVEIPSDYQGVLFIPFDKEGFWRFRLAKELKSVGFDVDMNKL